jgi:glycosyltransferase involved in cell wall biosynthesis
MSPTHRRGGASLRVLLITGSYPPDVCGTADYTARLCESLRGAGVDARVFYRKDWRLSKVPNLLREIDESRPDLVHMQYPTTGYGWKLGPQALGSLRPWVTTLHEASQAHLLRQLSIYPFLLRSRHFLFTNQYEREHVRGMAPWIARTSSTIPIGCNLPETPNRRKTPDLVTCFSIIRPEKGLEQVIELARLLQGAGSSARVRILGAVMPRWRGYFERLREESRGLPVDWRTGLDDRELSEALAETALAYLPFPDGASERRSSLVAMLRNRACVMTSEGPQTPARMKACVAMVASPAEAAATAAGLLREPEAAEAIARRGMEYSEQFSWESIARRHVEVYERLCR